MARNKSTNRCPRCQILRPLCLCGEIEIFDLSTRLLVLMHWRERKLSTNSALLAHLSLKNSEIRIRGEKGAPPEEPLLPPGMNGALLFPSEDAAELSVSVVEKLPRPLTIIVPDGNWRQAKRIANRVAADPGMIRLKLPLGEPSDYRLRRESKPENLSTCEAIARAFGLIEGPMVKKSLETLFLKMVERRLWSRGLLKASQCKTGIPEFVLKI